MPGERPRHRTTVGLFEAAILLVLAGMGLWLARPLPGARRSAAEEAAASALLVAVSDAEDAILAREPKGSPCLRLDRLGSADKNVARLLQDWSPSKVPGVYGNRSYWVAVLLPGRDGWLERPGGESPAEAGRGYCVVAWPRTEGAKVLRALAALPDGILWQRADGMEESGDPGEPPVPRASLAPLGQTPRVPAPPPDWAAMPRRKK